MANDAVTQGTSDLQSVTDRLFRNSVGPGSPGAVVAVTRHGREILRAAYGMADIAHGIPLDAHSVIRIGSQTKQFTVLLTLMLAAEGKLSLDDEVNRYLPWLPKYPVPVTLRHVATNTSGLREFLEVLAFTGIAIGSQSSRETARRVIARHADFNFSPGEAMIYCNTGFFLLSEIVEAVSGRTFNELLAERITGPLGMNDTRLMQRDTQILPRLAMHHTRGPDGGWHRAQWGVVLGGEGGMVSTLEDMLVWQANFADPKVGTAAMYQLLATPAVYRNGTTALYAHGLVSETYRGLRAVGHGGGVAGGRSESIRFPDQELGIVILGNRDDISPYSLSLRIADAALGSHMSSARVDADWTRLAAAAGMYRHEGGDDLFEIAIVDGVHGVRVQRRPRDHRADRPQPVHPGTGHHARGVLARTVPRAWTSPSAASAAATAASRRRRRPARMPSTANGATTAPASAGKSPPRASAAPDVADFRVRRPVAASDASRRRPFHRAAERGGRCAGAPVDLHDPRRRRRRGT